MKIRFTKFEGPELTLENDSTTVVTESAKRWVANLRLSAEPLDPRCWRKVTESDYETAQKQLSRKAAQCAAVKCVSKFLLNSITFSPVKPPLVARSEIALK